MLRLGGGGKLQVYIMLLWLGKNSRVLVLITPITVVIITLISVPYCHVMCIYFASMNDVGRVFLFFFSFFVVNSTNCNENGI